MGYVIKQTETFVVWHQRLRHRAARIAIARRLENVEAGTLGDVKSVGGGVSEMRVNIGPWLPGLFHEAQRRRCCSPLRRRQGDAGCGHQASEEDRRGDRDIKRKTTVKVTRFDIAEHLKEPEDAAEYLSQVLADGDDAELLRALGHIARTRGMAKVAAESGLGRESLYKALSPGAKPRYDTVLKVARALGVRLSASAA